MKYFERKKKIKNIEELEQDYKNEVSLNKQIFASPFFEKLEQYFLEKIELNRDLKETYNAFKEPDKIQNLTIENKVMRDFLDDIRSSLSL
jgi:hypothetical protein